ncbi:hypothetical protein HDU98_010812 [Podochytrium sp. JEL0797]|nr:hypothetical protein HDU98_010812 [Podochytrium sp. JEL0797]
MPAQNLFGGSSISPPMSPSTSVTTSHPSSAPPNKLHTIAPSKTSEKNHKLSAANQALAVAVKKELDKDLLIAELHEKNSRLVEELRLSVAESSSLAKLWQFEQHVFDTQQTQVSRGVKRAEPDNGHDESDASHSIGYDTSDHVAPAHQSEHRVGKREIVSPAQHAKRHKRRGSNGGSTARGSSSTSPSSHRVNASMKKQTSDFDPVAANDSHKEAIQKRSELPRRHAAIASQEKTRDICNTYGANGELLKHPSHGNGYCE